MAETEEYNVDILEGHLIGELQVCLADESFVHIANEIASIALGVGKDYFSLWMVQQQTNKFSAGVPCRT
jgi:hypothetical protein